MKRSILDAGGLDLAAIRQAIERKEDDIRRTLRKLEEVKRRRIAANSTPAGGAVDLSGTRLRGVGQLDESSSKTPPYLCCDLTFASALDLLDHQEGPAHFAISYYCPLTAEHCPRAPCERAKGGSGPSLVGRGALASHLRNDHRGHSGASAGLDLSWAGLASFRETSPRTPKAAHMCYHGGCKLAFKDAFALLTHQEEHSAIIPYYCPLTAEHCPRAPCDRALGGPGPSLMGRDSLRWHLRNSHHGHKGTAAGLNLSWAGLASFREASARAAPPSPASVRVCYLDGCTLTFKSAWQLLAHQESQAHLAIQYYCPLTAEHCLHAPCNRALGGSGPSMVGRRVLYMHLRNCHRGHTGASAGLDLSWSGLASFRKAATK